MRKSLVILIAVLLSLSVTSPALAAKPTISQGQFKADIDYWQFYQDWGPACYYGQNVGVHYSGTKHWNWVVSENGDVHQNMVQNGKAEVYEIDASRNPGNLIDIRPFHCMERYFDAGGDNSELRGNMYKASGNFWSSPSMEKYHYLFQINGIYRFECWNKNGNWSWGVCSGTYSWSSDKDGTYPPHPPHPLI